MRGLQKRELDLLATQMNANYMHCAYSYIIPIINGVFRCLAIILRAVFIIVKASMRAILECVINSTVMAEIERETYRRLWLMLAHRIQATARNRSKWHRIHWRPYRTATSNHGLQDNYSESKAFCRTFFGRIFLPCNLTVKCPKPELLGAQ